MPSCRSSELREHTFTHPTTQPSCPYRTSYYVERWGFCMSQRQLDALPPGEYRVVVDSTLAPGSVSYGEAVFPGATDEEVLLTTYACHPSLANDNLSGVALLAELGRALARQPALRFTYRLLWVPGTIGSICWLARNRATARRIRHGLVLSCLGDAGPFTYKRSRRGNTDIDRVAAYVLRSDPANRVLDWSPYGGDERQFCSPGFDLAVGAFSRTPADQFPEYHSSADDLELVRPERLGASFATVLDVLDLIESNDTYRNLSPYGEPQLGPRGLYRGIGGGSSEEMALLWVLSLSDGTHDLLEIAERSSVDFDDVRRRPTVCKSTTCWRERCEHGAEARRDRYGRRKWSGARDRDEHSASRDMRWRSTADLASASTLPRSCSVAMSPS